MVPERAAQLAFAEAQAAGRDLFEYEAKNLLRAHGVAVPEELLAGSADDLASIAARFGDQPLAMKVVSKDILHKSDAGGVKLNVRGEAGMRVAFDEIMAASRAYDSQAVIKGVLLTPMARKGSR